MKPTKKQIDDFWSKAEEGQIRELLEYAKDKAAIKEARKYIKVDVFEYLKNK